MEVKKGASARTRASNKYTAKTYDKVAIMVHKGNREKLKEIASRHGQSVNMFVISAINKRLRELNEQEIS